MQFTRPLRFQLPLMRGHDVRAVQQALTTLGIIPPCGTPDGVFGQQTRTSVLAFQAGWNARPGHVPALNTEGVVDASTFAELVAAIASEPGASHVLMPTPAIPPDSRRTSRSPACRRRGSSCGCTRTSGRRSRPRWPSSR